MHFKSFIAVFLASGFSFYLVFFLVHDRFTPSSPPHSVIEICCLWTGFVLSLPYIPLVFAIDLFHPRWPAFYTFALGVTLSACFWSVLARRVLKTKAAQT
jgi:hypothetical protein